MNNIIYVLIVIPIFLGWRTAQAGFEFVTNTGSTSLTITGYSGPENVVIPSMINGLAVTEIGAEAFSGEDITSVDIPDSVTNIETEAFWGCSSLTNAAIPGSVASIGVMAFAGSGLNTVTIWTGLINVGDVSFAGCSATNITIDMGVTFIESNMFETCDSLPSIVIPSSVTNVGEQAFFDCSALTNVFFSGNAPFVGEQAFANARAPQSGDPFYYLATAYYLPGTTGWSEFESNTLMISNE